MKPPRAQLLQHVAVADRGGAHGDPRLAHRQVQPEVAHHRGDEGVVGELARVAHGQREDRHDLVAVDDRRRRRRRPGSGRRRRRGRCPGRRRARDHRGAQRLQVGGAAAVVDVQPVGLGVDRDDLGARARGRRRARRRDGGAVRAVDDDASARRAGRGGRRAGGRRSGRRRRAGRGTRPMPGAGRARSADGASDEPPRSASSIVVGQLVPARGEDLDAVVGHRVVRRGDHHAEVGAERRGQVGDGRGGQHADPERRRRRRWRARRPPRPPASRRWPAGRGRPRATRPA